MTAQEREEMFSKDFLNISDIEKLCGVDYQTAAKLIRNIRRKNDRLKMQGRIHVQDYLDYYNIPPDRYVSATEHGISLDENQA